MAASSSVAPAEPIKAPPLSLKLNVQLSVMMFLQYAIWGAWLPLLFPYLLGHLHFSSAQIANVFIVGGIGAIVAPFIAGQLADRYFTTQRFLGVSHLIGGVLMWELGSLTEYWQFLLFSLIYSLVYSPTLSLTNSLAFHHLPDRNRDFGRVRVWGTLGWIAAGIAVAQWLFFHYSPAGAAEADLKAAQVAGIADAFRLSGILGIVLGLFCFLLPNTPPSPGKARNASLEAMGEVKHNPLLTLFLLAVPISCIHQFYFVHASNFLSEYQRGAAGLIAVVNRIFGAGGGGLMTIGQMSELFVLGFMPLLARRFSRKSLLAAGIFAYGLRMFLFAYVQPLADFTHIPPIAFLMVGIAMHGVCFGCFVFVAFMVVDEETTGDVRASAQSLFNLVMVGIGIIVGSYIATSVAQWATVTSSDGSTHMDYTRLFSMPMWASVACLAVLLVCYPRRRRTTAR
jgi:nucleoside transporter